MVLDQVENFVRVSVAGGHDSGDSTISLESGEASLLPDVTQGKYNLIWWDSENFSLPSEDPNVEIVRVNSINTSNDTISVTRGRENTSATSKNDPTGEYSLILGPTAKTIEDIDSTKLDASAYSPEDDTHTRYSDSEARGAINGSVIEPEQAIHSRSIDSSLTLSSDQGLVLAGPVSGSGSISGEGSFVVTDNQLGESEVINLIQSQSIDADTLDGLDASQLGIDVSNNASTIVSNATDINFSSGITASDDTDGTSTVSLDSISHDSLTNIGSSDHHARYSDSEAITAINNESSLSVDITGDADTLDGIDSTGFIQTNDTIDADTIDGTELADIAEGYNTAVTKTSDHTAIDSQVVLADATNNDINITLPSPTDGQLVTVKKIDSSNNAVNIVTPGDETIDGHSSIVITNQFAARETVSNGTNYFII